MMLLAVLAFVAVAVAILSRSRAMRIRDRRETGTFSGLAREIEGLWGPDGIAGDDVAGPRRRAA